MLMKYLILLVPVFNHLAKKHMRFSKYSNKQSKKSVYGKKSFLSKESDTLRSYGVYISPTK